MSRKGIVLVVSLMVLTVILILTGVYFSSLITEKKAADTEKYVLQALNLAEAGASQGISELRKRIRTDLDGRLMYVSQSAVILAYVSANNPLGFLRDYAYSGDSGQFNISGTEAALVVQPLSLNSDVQGNYSAIVRISSAGAPTNPQNEVYVFRYNFSVDATAVVTKTIPNITRSLGLVNGSFSITVMRDTFAKFALFTAHHRTPSNSVVWFTESTNFSGPVSTNERFSFARNPSAHFSEEVTQHNQSARFYNNGNEVYRDADYYSYIDRTGQEVIVDRPIFDKGFVRGAEIINITSSITQVDLKRQALGGTADPGARGIYIPNDGSNLIGGIYIKGNQGDNGDNPTISMSATASGPVYTITRESTTKVITINYAANQTTIQTGPTRETYSGIPDGVGNEGIIIYADDDIGSFSGTVEKDTNITVSSERNINLSGNVLYEQYNPSPLNALGFTNVLGILSWGGNVVIDSNAPDNVEIHGVVMAPHGVFTVDNYNRGRYRGIATLLGGVITDFYGAFGTFGGMGGQTGYGRNFVYDARMLQGTTPPYFPYLSNFTSSDDDGLDRALNWQDRGL